MVVTAVCKTFRGEIYLREAILSVQNYVDNVCIFLSDVPWNGPLLPPDNSEMIIQSLGMDYVKGHWRTEEGQKPNAGEMHENQFILDYVRDSYPRTTHVLVFDFDHVWTPALGNLLQSLKETNAGRVHGHWISYWKSFNYIIQPFEMYEPMLIFRLNKDTKFVSQSNVTSEPSVITPYWCGLHHMSFALSNRLVREKMLSTSDCRANNRNWYEHVWLEWDYNKRMINLCPDREYPYAFKRALPAFFPLPSMLSKHKYFGLDIIGDFDDSSKNRSFDSR